METEAKLHKVNQGHWFVFSSRYCLDTDESLPESTQSLAESL